jgi:hypothetical protein
MPPQTPAQTDEREEAMSPYFAVFNCHVNRAQGRATRAFKRKFGPEPFEKNIRPRLKEGIMSIFQNRPNRWTRWYVAKITEFVNEDRKQRESSDAL